MPGTALSVEEREEIRIGLEAGEPFAELARALGRPTSTISREVHRNGGRRAYRAVSAERRAVRKRRRPKSTRFEESPGLARHVETALRALDSPTTIAIELARAGGIDGLTVSPETIYQGIYARGARGLAAGLGGCLHRKRRRRRPRVRAGGLRKAGPLGQFNLIGLRGEIAALRSEVGHFEGDLIIGAHGRSAVVTLVDRMSRYNLLGELPHGHDATSVLACLTGLLERVPDQLRRTLTWDQGREMARHLELAQIANIDVFFAEPHHPWQRPSNEAFNGLLRRYVGKGTNLAVYSQADLDVISYRLNTMPRRIHNWRSAADCYDPAVVAATA